LHKFSCSPLTCGKTLTTNSPAKALADNVWFTRKAWINAEERLLKNDFHTQLLMVVYAAYTSCLSVVLLKYEPSPSDKNLIDTSLAVLSIILLALSLYLNTKSFRDRAARFKTGYHDLHLIERGLESLALQFPSPQVDVEFAALSVQYDKALREVETHAELDDIHARITAGDGLTSRRVTRTDKCRYYWWRIWRFGSLILAYGAPAAGVLCYVFK